MSNYFSQQTIRNLAKDLHQAQNQNLDEIMQTICKHLKIKFVQDTEDIQEKTAEIQNQSVEYVYPHFAEYKEPKGETIDFEFPHLATEKNKLQWIGKNSIVICDKANS